MRYNVATSSGNNSGALSGGFTMTGSSFDDGNMYIIQVSFDGTTWNSDFSSMVASAGFLVGGVMGVDLHLMEGMLKYQLVMQFLPH